MTGMWFVKVGCGLDNLVVCWTFGLWVGQLECGLEIGRASCRERV
jgi:hypothetical protein